MPLALRTPEQLSSLPARLLYLGQARRRAIVVRGILEVGAILLAGIALAGMLDALLNLAPLVRAFFLVGILSVSGAYFVRHVLQPAREPVTPLNVALLLEKRFPKLNDALASAVEFQEQAKNPQPTSAKFRRIALVRAENILERYNTNQIVPSGRAWRAFWLFALAVGVIAPLTFINMARAQHTMLRLMMPFSKAATKTQITLSEPKTPLRMAKGDPLDVKFTLKGIIPERATVRVKLSGGGDFEEHAAIPNANPPEKTADVHIVLDAGRTPRDFQFKVVANDAETDWLSVNVAPPPKLVPREGRASPQLRRTYPAYTDRSPEDVPDGETVVEAVAGTRIRLRAATDRRIVSATLRPQTETAPLFLAASLAQLSSTNPLGVFGQQQLADQIPADIHVSVSGEGGTLLDAEFTPSLACLYSLRFTDDTGLTGTRTVDLRLLFKDPAPIVVMERPIPAKDAIVLLPTASVSIQARAEDRQFAVRGLFVEYRIGGPDAEWKALPMSDSSELAKVFAGVGSGLSLARPNKPVSLDGGMQLPLSLLRNAKGLPPADGDLITLRAAATDFDDVTVLKEPGRSREVEIQVLAPNSFDSKVQQELGKLRPEILRAKEEQRQAREKVEEAAKAAEAGKLKPEDLAKLRAAEQAQRNLRNQIAEPNDGLKARAEQLKEAIEANKLPRSPTTDRAEALAKDLGRLTEQHLDPTDPILGSAKDDADKLAKPETKPDELKKLAKDLNEAAKLQKASEDALDAMLRKLERWGGAGELRAEARLLKDQANKAAEQAEKATGKIDPGKLPESLTPAERKELAKANEKFQQLAERATGVLGKTERFAEEKEKAADKLNKDADTKAEEAATETDPKKKAELEAQAAKLRNGATQAKAEADALRKAIREAGGKELADDFRKAGEEIERNNPSQATDAGKKATDKLDKFAQALTEQQPNAMDELKKKQETADAVAELANKQEELRKKTKKANEIADPKERQDELNKLAREQETIQRQVEEQVERLTRQEQNPEAAEQLKRAAEEMKAARENLEQGKGTDEKQADALERLDETVKKLDRENKQDENKLSKEKREQLAEQLKGLRERLKATDDEAARIHADVLKAEKWDRAKLASLRDLEDRAKAVSEELRQFSEKNLEPLPVFRQLVDQAAILTNKAAKLLNERKEDAADSVGNPLDKVAEATADERTRRPLRTALRRIDHVLNSLKEDPKPQAGQPMNGDNPGGGGGNMPMGGGMGEGQTGVPPQAQIKALRAIQAELNERTVAFEKAHPNKEKLNPADEEELEELERSQREVAELFRKVAEQLKNQPMPEMP